MRATKPETTHCLILHNFHSRIICVGVELVLDHQSCPSPPGASWPPIDSQMLPLWGGRGQGRRVPGGPAESLCPKMPMGRAGEKEGQGPFCH